MQKTSPGALLAIAAGPSPSVREDQANAFHLHTLCWLQGCTAKIRPVADLADLRQERSCTGLRGLERCGGTSVRKGGRRRTPGGTARRRKNARAIAAVRSPLRVPPRRCVPPRPAYMACALPCGASCYAQAAARASGGSGHLPVARAQPIARSLPPAPPARRARPQSAAVLPAHTPCAARAGCASFCYILAVPVSLRRRMPPFPSGAAGIRCTASAGIVVPLSLASKRSRGKV